MKEKTSSREGGSKEVEWDAALWSDHGRAESVKNVGIEYIITMKNDDLKCLPRYRFDSDTYKTNGL